MWWVIGIIAFVILLFLWVIVRSAAHSIDADTQAMYDEEQSRYIEKYFEEKERHSKKTNEIQIGEKH